MSNIFESFLTIIDVIYYNKEWRFLISSSKKEKKNKNKNKNPKTMRWNDSWMDEKLKKKKTIKYH